MARIKHYNVGELKKVFEVASGWPANFSHKYGTETMGAAIINCGWAPVSPTHPFNHQNWTVTKSWSQQQRADFVKGREDSRQNGTIAAKLALDTWFQDKYPDLAIRIVVDSQRIFIESVNAKEFGIQTNVTPTIDASDAIHTLLQSIEI